MLILMYSSLHVKNCSIRVNSTGQCPHKVIETPACARTICDHARENSQKTIGAWAIINFAGDLQIAKIVGRQFYL